MQTSAFPKITEAQKSRFWSKVAIAEPDDCWVWQGGTRKGYGRLEIQGSTLMAHRVAYFLAHGPYPKDQPYTLHSCDNPPCCNPAHLACGTYDDNNRDRVLKGRGNPVRGERHGFSKFTEKLIQQIRHLYHQKGVPQFEIANQLSISRPQVSRIIRRKIWTHL